MNLFKFINDADPTDLISGAFINHVTSVMWVERYSNAGEFEIKSTVSSGLQDFLPVGTLISHVDTMEVMIVENHHIVDDGANDPTLIITGRSFETYLENRIVGAILARTSGLISEYVMPIDYLYIQIISLINAHITNATVGLNDRIPHVQAYVSPGIAPGSYEARTISPGTIYDRVQELLKIDDLGIRTVRKNPFGLGPWPNANQTVFDIYSGLNKTNTVQFSWSSGDFNKIEYLFSQKNQKNSAMVMGRYCWTVVDLGSFEYNRRIMLVDASDIDGNLSAAPAGGALGAITTKMAVRGRQALKAQQNITISSADVSNMNSYKYREDYNVGDLVMLDGHYRNNAVMRVTEYAEIEDENGQSGHPTLSVPGV